MIRVEISGIAEVQRTLEYVASPTVQREVMRSVGEYAQGQMRKYPEYTYVSRTQAYGKPFQSDKQRRWFFAALRSGELTIPYRRTQTLQRGWKLQAYGASDFSLINDVPYASYVQLSPQARMMTYRFWRSLQTMVMQERAQIYRVANDALNRALKRARR